MRVVEILLRQGKVSQAQLDSAASRRVAGAPERRIEDVLVEENLVTESDLLQALAEDFRCGYLEDIPDEHLDSSLVSRVPVEWVRSQGVLPIRWRNGVGVLTSDPDRVSTLDDLSLLLGREVTPVLASRQQIAKAIERCYYQKKDTAEDLLRGFSAETSDANPAPRGGDDLLRMADQTPVTQLVNVILLDALKARASDVHVEPFERNLRVRFRVDGVLYEQASPPKNLQVSLISRLKVMAHMDIAERRLPQDGTARVRVGEREIDIRVSTVPVAEGERVVLRLLNRDSTLMPLADLGMSDGVLGGLRTLLGEPNGIILVTGPTGSGKTTTLYAALQELDTSHVNVLTIEDPIEYQLPNVGQIQVKPKIGLSFASGLRHILRQDPDVVLVGETRDLETAEIAVRAAMTGHLVFTTLHTNDATSAAVRLTDMGIQPYILSSALKASLAQRLVRTLCAKCRKRAPASPGDVSALGRAGARLKGAEVFEMAGCAECLGGFKGRRGLYELMVVNAAIQEAIRSGMTAQDLRRLAMDGGMKSLADDGVDKILAGLTSTAELLRTLGHTVMEAGG